MPLPTHTIISGGQIGADIAALRAARRLTWMSTGGWMPQGFRTLQGDRPEYQSLFAMREATSRGYPQRTYWNVRDSDATVRFAHNFNSPGERCTQNAVRQYSRHQYDIATTPSGVGSLNEIAYFRQWLTDMNVYILNVAGNAAIWMEPLVEDFLFEVFDWDETQEISEDENDHE